MLTYWSRTHGKLFGLPTRTVCRIPPASGGGRRPSMVYLRERARPPVDCRAREKARNQLLLHYTHNRLRIIIYVYNEIFCGLLPLNENSFARGFNSSAMRIDSPTSLCGGARGEKHI